jgi:quercetin dioxygenase-like cupin family protein
MEAFSTIIKNRDAKRRQFKGISLDVLAVGEKSMVTRMNYKAGDVVPVHSHPHEQCGYVVAGRARLTCGGQEDLLEPGDSYYIPGGVPHGLHALEDGHIIDFFVPIREDYL